MQQDHGWLHWGQKASGDTKDQKVSFLHHSLQTTCCRGVVVWFFKYAGIFSQRARIWWLSSRSGLLGGPLYFHPLRCQILEEASDEALSAWRREITPTLQRYGTAADWLHNPSNHAKPQLSSDAAPRRSTASAARYPSTNKACCCLPHTWTLRPDRRIWTWRQTSPSACFGSSALVANSSNRAPSVGRSSQATLKSHPFPDAAAISSLRRRSATTITRQRQFLLGVI